MWNFREGFTDAENATNALKVKAALEDLQAAVPEIVKLTLHINQLKYSTKDVMLDSLFADEAAFLAYMEHPGHIAAGAIVKEFFDGRETFDYHDH